MRRAIGWAWKALIVVACVAYQVLVHASVIGTPGGTLRAVLLWLPLVVLAGWVVARARNKPAWLAVLAVAGAAVYLAEHRDQLGLAVVSGIPHALAYLFLLWWFGRSLARGSEPMVTRFARRVHGVLPADMERFTRNVTIAWCIFFAAQLVVSALLFALAPLDAWSVFVNLLNLPLLALMFAGQFICRNVRHPEFPRASAWQALEAFTQDALPSGGTELR